MALSARHRWCLTGTPLQNSADDVQPLMAFLRVAPLADHSVWRDYVGRPIRSGDPLGLTRLRVAIRYTHLLVHVKRPNNACEEMYVCM
jgi:SWI/SNF-related matrix-associated actin-dependent regulator of chromatin subfamily A3